MEKSPMILHGSNGIPSITFIPPKPIFIIGLPQHFVQLAENLEQEIAEKFSDYRVITHTTSKEDFTFQAFYEKDFNEVKYEELKQIIKDSVK